MARDQIAGQGGLAALTRTGHHDHRCVLKRGSDDSPVTTLSALLTQLIDSSNDSICDHSNWLVSIHFRESF